MYFKLAKRNMYRSIKDYVIYFITLIFSVALFYTFNSIEDQKVLLDFDTTWKSAFKTISVFMNIASVFVVFILAFLIIYSNNYLIRRRKKEFGIYLTLGMENRGVSKILFIETFILGIFSLGLGLLLGIFVSQILSVFTAKLFEVNMAEFKFIFSASSLFKTIVAFGSIYILTGIFNLISFRKIKLIDLIYAHKKNESIKIKNPALSFILFIMSMALIGAGYYIVLHGGVAVINKKIVIAIILGCIGTFLFFMSLSGFLLKILQIRNKIYYKDLNMFLIRQLNSKVNSASVSISFICLMLFLAICMLSSGLSLNKSMNKAVKDLTPYNMSLCTSLDVDMPQLLSKNNVDLNKYADSYNYVRTYIDKIKYSDILDKEYRDKYKSYYPINVDENVEFIKLSDVNKELKYLGRNEINLNNDEFMFLSDVNDIFQGLKKSNDKNKRIKVNNKDYKLCNEPIIELSFFNAPMKTNIALIVIEDSAVSNMQPECSYLSFNYKNGDKNMEENLKEIFNNINKGNDYFYAYSDKDIENSSKGIGGGLSFLGIYLGIIFIIASSAVLAIQELSNIDDNIKRYSILRKIGAEDSSIFKSIEREIGIYFGMPLILAVVHSVVGLKLANDIIVIFGSSSTILKLMIISAAFIAVIYGTYYIGTCICAKNLIRRKC